MLVLALLFLALGWLLLPGCGTIAPKPVVSHQASFDPVPDAKGNYQNSGLLGWATNHSAIITPTARDRYNALCSVWGKRFTPPVVPPDAGLTPWIAAGVTNGWLMNPAALDKFMTMSTWERQPPLKPP